MHHSKIATCERLQRTLRVLQKAKGGISTRDLADRADICAVNSTIAELRENGAEITCRQVVRNGKRRWLYTLIKSPEGQS
tara:strand:- start:1086 stop:1325 length:240 start_codon:yes stop_codon:yes gene_type:complete